MYLLPMHLQTIKGAVELLQATGEHIESAIDKVTTPGGCTIKGLKTMEQEGFTNAVIKDLLAGKRKKNKTTYNMKRVCQKSAMTIFCFCNITL